MFNSNLYDTFEIGNSLRDFKNFEITAHRKVKAFGGLMQDIPGWGLEVNKTSDFGAGERTVVNPGALITLPLPLYGFCYIIFDNVMFGDFVLSILVFLTTY